MLRAAVDEASAADRQAYRNYVESRLPELGLQHHDVARRWESTCPVCDTTDWIGASLPIF